MEASLYDLVHLKDDDRKKMVDMMELDQEERKRIQKELDRIATAGNEHFLQMTKQIIQLIIEKKVNLEKTKNSAEVYLMLLLATLTSTQTKTRHLQSWIHQRTRITSLWF